MDADNERIRIHLGNLRHQRTKPDVAADALYRLGVYSSDPNRYGKTPQLLTDGQNLAWATWKQLRDEYPEPAQRLLHLGQPDDKLEQIAATIDKRNSIDWKYQIIDSFVKLTGKQPA